MVQRQQFVQPGFIGGTSVCSAGYVLKSMTAKEKRVVIMMNNHGSLSWLCLLGRNGWVWDSEKSIDEDYSFYGAQILGSGYYVQCWARVSTNDKGYSACGDWGVAWIECDVSIYTSRDFLGRDDAKEILSAIDHAETTLLTCGIPFTDGYRFSGKNAHNKALRNEAIRRRLRLQKYEEVHQK